MRWMRPLLIALACAFMLASAAQAQDEAGIIVGRINELRATRGLGGYTPNGALAAAAQRHAQWIAESGSVSHVQPDGSGPRTRAQAAGYPSTQVTENIYGGTQATVETAWGFWVNSDTHFRGMVNAAYSEIGVGIARSEWGTAYVVLFGSPTGLPPAPPPGSGGSGGSVGGGNSGESAPVLPSYVVGVDEAGNIMHEIQPDDTIGDIALIYGYSWDDIPALMALNNVADVRDLDIGAVFLVPPHDGTYTPTPEPIIPPTNTRVGSPETPETPTETPEPTPSATPAPTDTPTPMPIATVGRLPEALLAEITPQSIAAVPTLAEATPLASVTTGASIIRSGRSPWLLVAVLVQAGIIVAAAIEFFRRRRR